MVNISLLWIELISLLIITILGYTNIIVNYNLEQRRPDRI